MSRQLLKSTAVVGLMTLLSRVLGFVRDVVFARVFGAGAATDAFFVAFRIPNFLRRLFAEGAFSQAFVPVLSEYRSQRGEDEVRELVDRVAGTLGLILLLVTVIGVIAAPVLIMIFAPGFIGDAGKYDPAVAMLRLTFPYLLFISLTAFAGSILNTWGRFAVPAVTPVLLNLSLIAAAIWLSPHMANPVMALAVGVFVAGLTQLLFQLPFLWRIGLLPRPRLRRGHEGVRRIMKLMLPALFGSSVAQINLLFDTLIASFLLTGSVSWLYYSDRLVEFPLGVFGIALATVILPSLSRRHAEDDPMRYSQTLDWALRWVVMIGLPAMLALILLAAPILTSLFQYGEFGARDVRQASLSLMAYALGLPAFILIKVQATGFFARQDTATPVRIGIHAMLANMVMNVVLVAPLIWFWSDAPHTGLALATSMSAWLQAWLLNRRLRSAGIYRPGAGWATFVLRVLLAVVAMGLVIYHLDADAATWLGWDVWARIRHLLALVLAGVLSYPLFLLMLGIRPWRLQAA